MWAMLLMGTRPMERKPAGGKEVQARELLLTA
jgi:hypothetical protein